MGKKKLKESLGILKDFQLIDTHRLTPKRSGGIYEPGNVALKEPVEHMKEHGNYKERVEEIDKIKSLMDDRRQIMKLLFKIENQILAYQRGVDNVNEITLGFLYSQRDTVKEELKTREKEIRKTIKAARKTVKILDIIISVKGTGEITAANLLSYIEIEKARHASSLWAYCGYDKPSHSRYEKGTAGGGNKTLRTALYVWAGVQIKQGGPYREVYDRTKARLSISEKIVKSRNTKGQLVEIQWKETKPSHRHGAAIRKMIKCFLADLWIVWRTVEGLSTNPCYAEAMLSGNHRTVMPEERGWIY